MDMIREPQFLYTSRRARNRIIAQRIAGFVSLVGVITLIAFVAVGQEDRAFYAGNDAYTKNETDKTQKDGGQGQDQDKEAKTRLSTRQPEYIRRWINEDPCEK